MKKSIIIVILPLCFNTMFVIAQVTKTNVVEHFTNTSCSVCASNNPGIQNSLDANPKVLHISFHPSSPYITDIFNQSNKIENDSRTNFYNVYGATPKTVLNGALVAYNSLSSALPLLINETSNYQVRVEQLKISKDSFVVETRIKKVANDTTKNALLFLGAMEDTVFQKTSNGENLHYNVFRKSLTNTNGLNINLPIFVGDSVVIKTSYTANVSWRENRLNAIAILQHLNKSVINSSMSLNKNLIPSGIVDFKSSNARQFIYPNPTNGILYVNETIKNLKIYESNGKEISEFRNLKSSEIIDVSGFKKGIYFFVISDINLLQTQKIVIE